MKKIFLWILAASVIAFLVAWVYIVNSKSYEVGVNWVERSSAVHDEAGSLKYVFPDIGKYRIYGAGSVQEAKYAIFVVGTKKRVRVEVLTTREKSGWKVVEAKMNGVILHE